MYLRTVGNNSWQADKNLLIFPLCHPMSIAVPSAVWWFFQYIINKDIYIQKHKFQVMHSPLNVYFISLLSYCWKWFEYLTETFIATFILVASYTGVLPVRDFGSFSSPSVLSLARRFILVHMNESQVFRCFENILETHYSI